MNIEPTLSAAALLSAMFKKTKRHVGPLGRKYRQALVGVQRPFVRRRTEVQAACQLRLTAHRKLNETRSAHRRFTVNPKKIRRLQRQSGGPALV